MQFAVSLKKASSQRVLYRTRQRGVALLLMLLVVLMIGGTFGFQALNVAATKSGIEDPATTKVLAQSKDALLAWAQTVDTTVSDARRAIRPGALPYPDVYGAATISGPIIYDGLQDLGCIQRNWTVAASQNHLTPRTPVSANIRCFGKIPWRLLGLDLVQDGLSDGAGLVPWYAVSANLVAHIYGSECPARMDASIATASAASCGSMTVASTRPYPWLTVRDAFGNILSNRVAAVIIVPGPPTTRQTGTLAQTNRSSTLVGPDQFLDTVGNALCTGGFCDNARYSTTPATTPMEFIQCVAVSTTLNDSRFSQPYSCNDRLIYITIDELMQAASDRIAVEAINCISAFAKAKTRAPFASNAGGNRDAIDGLTTGFIPSSDWDETGANQDWLAYCPFFSNTYWDSWQQVVSYDVSPTHTVAGGWGGAGTLLIPGKQGTYKVTLSININGVSRWYGIQ